MWFSLTFPWLFQSVQNSPTFPWLENAFPFFQVFQFFQSEWEPCNLLWNMKVCVIPRFGGTFSPNSLHFTFLDNKQLQLFSGFPRSCLLSYFMKISHEFVNQFQLPYLLKYSSHIYKVNLTNLYSIPCWFWQPGWNCAERCNLTYHHRNNHIQVINLHHNLGNRLSLFQITSWKSTTCWLRSITNTCLKREWTRSVLEPVWVPVLEWRLSSTTREISSPSYIFSMNLHISPGQPGWQRSVIPVGPHARGVRIILHSFFFLVFMNKVNPISRVTVQFN